MSISCNTYCAHDSMSRAGTRVSSPAQRPTIVSTPSAQRTGAPTARSRSSNTTSSSGAACLAYQAATAPAGPAPTTRTSTSGIDNHGERPNGAGGDALLAAGAGCVIDRQEVQLEVDRLRRAERQTEATTIAGGEVHHGNCVGRHATHGRKPSPAC